MPGVGDRLLTNIWIFRLEDVSEIRIFPRMVTIWSGVVEYDNEFDEYLITFPEDMLVALGWKEGDTIDYVLQDGKVTLVNRGKYPLVEDMDEYSWLRR